MSNAEITTTNAQPVARKQAYYTVAELAERWRVTRYTIYRLANEGSIKRSRIGGSVRFSAETVAAYERTAG